MSRKDQTFPVKLLSAKSLGSSFDSPAIPMLFRDRGSLSVNVLSGSAVGTFQLQGRTSFSKPANGSAPVYPASTGPDTEWVPLVGTAQASPAAGSSISWDISETGYTEIRVDFISTSGTGTADVWFASKQSG